MQHNLEQEPVRNAQCDLNLPRVHFGSQLQLVALRRGAYYAPCKQRLLAREATTVIPSLVLTSPFRLLLSSLFDPLKYVLAVLVNLQLCNHDLARRYAHRYARPVRLLFRDSLDVDDIFETVHGGDFAFAAFVGATGNGDFVVFADGDGADL